jgi:hypothetical protein
MQVQEEIEATHSKRPGGMTMAVPLSLPIEREVTLVASYCVARGTNIKCLYACIHMYLYVFQ